MSLSLAQIRALTDLSIVAELAHLKELNLDRMSKVVRFPSLKKMNALRKVRPDSMKGLADVKWLATAPALAELEIYQASLLEPRHFRCLVGHPTLRKVRIGMGSVGKNAAVADILKISGQYGGVTVA